MKFENAIKVLDVLTWVEIVKTGDRTIYRGRLKDINISELEEYSVYKIVPMSNSKEVYLEIDVY